MFKAISSSMKSWEWELPAGMIDTDDIFPIPIETAKRELEEETGYTAEH
jgi:ADP-ribose pyrophosphatase